jgi:hypothetical protein
MVPLMLIWLGMGFLEYQAVSLLSAWEQALFDFVTMFISWVAFFRAFVNFHKERFVRVWLILACIIPVSLANLYFGAYSGAFRSVKSYLDSKTDDYTKQADAHQLRIEAGRKALDAIANERIEDLNWIYGVDRLNKNKVTENGKSTTPTWGDGLEKHWLATLKWDYEEIYKITENMQAIALFNFIAATVVSSLAWLIWLLPMSIVAGKIAGLIRLRASPAAEVLNTGQRRYLISTGDWTVLANDRNQESPRQFIRSKELSLQVFPTRHLSIREVFSEVISAFRGRASSTAPAPSP